MKEVAKPIPRGLRIEIVLTVTDGTDAYHSRILFLTLGVTRAPQVWMPSCHWAHRWYHSWMLLGLLNRTEVEPSKRSSRKRTAIALSELNACLCNLAANPQLGGVIQCKQNGCETRWVSFSCLGKKKLVLTALNAASTTLNA